MIPTTDEGNGRLLSSKRTNACLYDPDSEQYYATTAANGNERDGALKSSEPIPFYRAAGSQDMMRTD